MSSLGGTSSTYWFCTIDRTSVNSRNCSYVAPVSVPLLTAEPPSDRVSTTSSEPITHTFFMESPRARIASDPLLGVLRPPLVPHLEIEARPLEGARVPHCPDALPLLHVVAFLHQGLGDVRIERVVLVVVVQDDQVAVALEPSRIHDVPREHGRHITSLDGLDVHAIAKRPRAEPRMHLGAERAHHPALRRPRQPAAKQPESYRRSLGTRLRRRDLGQAALPGLQLADEGFQ